MIKKIILIIQLTPLWLFAQSGMYPIQDYYGGGIGYSPTYILLDSIPGSSLMSQMGLNTNNFDSPFIIHGGEGFTHIAGRWRLGGYAGIGSSSISNIMDIYLYKELNDTTGLQISSDSIMVYDTFKSTVTAKFSFTLGAVLLEYVVPIFRDLEISGGAMLGIGRVNVSIDQHTGDAQWNNLFSNTYGTVQNGSVYYEIPADTSFDSFQNSPLVPVNHNGGLMDLSGTFFNFQPYIAIKWQIMDRVGLRMTLGFNQGTIGAGEWKLNGRKQIADSPKATLQGLAIRTMFYFGL